MMLTLVLVVGAVSCSPLPSEPSLQASATHHGTSPAGAAPLEVTHGAHQVTFEVSEELSETTASTTSSELSGEDDPPIPTATTPPVLPDSDHHNTNSAVTEPHLTQSHHNQHTHSSHGSPLVIQSHEPHEAHHEPNLQAKVSPPRDLQENRSLSSNSHPQTSIFEITQPRGTSTGVTFDHDSRADVQSHATSPKVSQPQRSSEEILPHNHKITEVTPETVNDKGTLGTDASWEASTEKSSSSREEVGHSPEHKGLESESPIKQQFPKASSTRESNERGHEVKTNLQNTNSSAVPHTVFHHHQFPKTSSSRESNERGQEVKTNLQNTNSSAVSHTVFHHHPHEEVETIVEADLHSWESSEHRHFSPSAIKAAAENANAREMLTLEGSQEAGNAAPQIGRVHEALLVGDSQDGKEKVEYIDTVALSTDTEEDTTDENVRGGQILSGIKISMARDGSPHHSHEMERSNDKPSEETTEDEIKGQIHEHADPVDKETDEKGKSKHSGEREELPSLVMDSSSPIDIVERSEEAEREVLKGAASETVVETAPREAKLTPPAVAAEEARRRSHINLESSIGEESEFHGTSLEDDLSVQDQKVSENPSDPKPLLGGLESMSMTSPTPDTPQSEGTLFAEEAEATIVPPETFTETGNVTASETEDKIEESEEGSVLLPSVASPPTEDYTDNYSDPISTGNLPDIAVTQEEIPSVEHPQTDLPLLSTNDKEGGGGGSLRKEGKVAWALPPQQEQVSAVAPNSLTPGCIVAIVFGVILSVIVMLGIGGFVVWQRRTLNRPKVLGADRGYAGSDSGGYIDDQVRVSYVNSQIDSPKGSPEDLISLDNDSFLNSLESMTIQNLWTDNIRHTKL